MQVKLGLLLLILAATLTGCGGGKPEKVVEQMYQALQEGDSDAYMDTLLPENRSMPDLDGVLGTLLGSVGMSAGPVGVNLGGLLRPTFKNLEIRTVSKDGDHAVVEARGAMRMMMMEFPFCETHDLTREGGRWYIDKFHPARSMRLERLATRNRERLLAQEGTASSDVDSLDAMTLDDIAGLFSTFGNDAEIMLDMCE